MADKSPDIPNFFADLLGLAPPWSVREVVSEAGAQRVDVHLECAAEGERFQCGRCEQFLSACDYSPPRTWRHLDTCGRKTFLHAGLPVIECPTHGGQYARPPWGNKDSAFTTAFEQMVTSVCGEIGDIGKAARFLRVEQAQIASLLKHTPKETRKDPLRGGGAPGNTATPPSPPVARQPSLFAGNDMSFANLGAKAFRNMELAEAVGLYHKHRGLYPKGFDVSHRLAAAEFLLRGIEKAPAGPMEQAGYLCGLWKAFEEYLRAEITGREALAAEVKSAFFSRVVAAVERSGLVEPAFLPGEIPVGYVYLQAGRYEEAIRSLLNHIAKTPGNAALYGYLGDAYLLRGDKRVARQCYREACLIDTAGIDWHHVKDEDLIELNKELLFLYGPDPAAALEWLPSHARINGLFERKVVSPHDGLKTIIDDYLRLERHLSSNKAPVGEAKLFFRGIILCENREYLKFIKKIDIIEVRKAMKRVNPDLFEDFLREIAG
ncbi:MAG: transposase family protein [Syntrophobacteraceae bacterium]